MLQFLTNCQVTVLFALQSRFVLVSWSVVIILSWCVYVLQGYRQKDYFIATQGPLAHTVDDFWRMVWEWKCHSIVMLTELQERDQVLIHVTNPLSHDFLSALSFRESVCVCCRTSVCSTGLLRTRWLTETSQWKLKETRCVTRSVSEICCSLTARWVHIMSLFALYYLPSVCLGVLWELICKGCLDELCVCVLNRRSRHVWFGSFISTAGQRSGSQPKVKGWSTSSQRCRNNSSSRATTPLSCTAGNAFN